MATKPPIKTFHFSVFPGVRPHNFAAAQDFTATVVFGPQYIYIYMLRSEIPLIPFYLGINSSTPFLIGVYVNPLQGIASSWDDHPTLQVSRVQNIWVSVGFQESTRWASTNFT